MRGQCLRWVNRAGLTLCQPLPVFPEQRTSPDRHGCGWCQLPDPAISPLFHRTRTAKSSLQASLNSVKKFIPPLWAKSRNS